MKAYFWLLLVSIGIHACKYFNFLVLNVFYKKSFSSEKRKLARG